MHACSTGFRHRQTRQLPRAPLNRGRQNYKNRGRQKNQGGAEKIKGAPKKLERCWVFCRGKSYKQTFKLFQYFRLINVLLLTLSYLRSSPYFKMLHFSLRTLQFSSKNRWGPTNFVEKICKVWRKSEKCNILIWEPSLSVWRRSRRFSVIFRI